MREKERERNGDRDDRKTETLRQRERQRKREVSIINLLRRYNVYSSLWTSMEFIEGIITKGHTLLQNLLSFVLLLNQHIFMEFLARKRT